MVNKPGIFMEVLMEEIKKAGLKEPKVIGVGLDLKDAEHWNSEEITNIIAELKENLSKWIRLYIKNSVEIIKSPRESGKYTVYLDYG